jgi:hypothetical protein
MTILPRGIGLRRGKAIYEDSVALGFGKLILRFRGAQPGQRFSIEETHVPFVVSEDTPAHLELACRIGAIEPVDGPITSSAGRSWDLRQHPDGSEDIVFRGGRDFGIEVWHLHLDAGFRTGSLVEAPVMPDPFVRADGYPLLEYCVARLLGRHDGVLIHASTAIVDDGAYVFVGHSGAGKSTMAAIAEAAGARIPTDDRTIITSSPPAPMAWGTPWHGSLVRKSPEGAPIRGIYLLQQAKEDRCEPLAPRRAVKELFVRLIQPRLHAAEVDNTLRILEYIVERVPVMVLQFRPTAAAFELALNRQVSPR